MNCEIVCYFLDTKASKISIIEAILWDMIQVKI